MLFSELEKEFKMAEEERQKHEMEQSAEMLYGFYKSLVQAGFSKNVALILVKTVLMASIKN